MAGKTRKGLVPRKTANPFARKGAPSQIRVFHLREPQLTTATNDVVLWWCDVQCEKVATFGLS